MPDDIDNNQEQREQPQAKPVPPPPQTDLGEQSLADALRISFRVLTVIMVCIVVAFLLTGIKEVDATQRGIRTLFAKIVGTSEPGLVYTWFYPVGGIELIDVREQTLTIDDFWMYESPDDKLKPLQDRKPTTDGLRPGWDGALLTGDRYLLHVRLICKYQRDNVGDWKKNVSDENELIRSAVCAAAIRAAATRTGDSLQRDPKEKEAFKTEIRMATQRSLDRMHAGINIKRIEVPQEGIAWPLKAMQAFNDVTTAIQNKQSFIDQARGDAEDILNAAAGENYRMLVGKPWLGDQGGQNPSEQADNEPYDLIGKYELALKDDDNDRAQRLLEKINEVLSTCKGQGRGVIEQAKSYKTTIVKHVESYANRFEQLLEQLPDDPQGRKLMYDRLWLKVQDEVLNSPTVEKHWVPPGKDGRMILIIPRDRDIARQIRRALTRKKKQENDSTSR